MSLVPMIKAVAQPAPAQKKDADALVQVIRETVVVKEAVAPRRWSFVPRRDENNLIVEIIATPIE